MWIVLLFISGVIVCFSLIIYSRVKENYLLLRDIGNQNEYNKIYRIVGDSEEEELEKNRYIGSFDIQPEDTDTDYKNKYSDGDYSKIHQRRAIGQIRDDGEDH